MELPPISASLGAIGSLAGKLELDPSLDAEELKVEMAELRSRLVLLSEAWDPPVEARIWMKDVRELSYDMENRVDLARPEWVGEMTGFKARVKEANEWYDTHMLGTIPISTTSAVDFQIPMVDGRRRRRPDLAVVGLDDGPFRALCEWLMTDDDDKALKVLSILGVGGIGKTTLAKQLWREHKPGGYFDRCAFVRAAKKPDMRRFLRSILAQVRPHQPPTTNEVHELIHDIRQHLQGKRYFLIIDDLWATSVWDVARRAFPEGTGSRIVTTTEMKKVALACCSYQSKHIFKMEPLSDRHSKELFISRVLGSGEEKSHQLDDASKEIIRRCAGLPLAVVSISNVLASQGEANAVQNREKIQNILPTNTTPVEVLKEALNFCYNCLPIYLQTCLLYLSIYPENYIILKEDIVKQWVTEGFIGAATENEKIKVAESYFDKLVDMGMVQHIDVGYSNEIYYYAVHPMVHNLITSKSREENFMTVVDYSERTVGFSNKVSRLSLQFGSATHATRPEIIGLSQVRSLAFIGLKSCYSSILEFKVLRVLILHIWADQPRATVDLKPTSKLVLLRSLQVTCNETVHLPDLMQGPKHLETLEINAMVAAIPANIVHLRSWLHLRLGVGTEVPDLTGTLKIVNTSNPSISLDDSSCSPDLMESLKTMELFSPIRGIPKWIGQLTNLSILKFVVGELLLIDICNLHKLPFLTVLSLHILRPDTGPLGFVPGGFAALEYFEFRCGVLHLRFLKGTMPNLQRLKLAFNAHQGEGEQYSCLLVGIEDLLSVKEISGIIGVARGAVESDFKAAESAFEKAMGRHLNVNVERADMVEELYDPAENQHEHTLHYQTTINQESEEARGRAEKQRMIRGKHTQDYQTEITEESQDAHGRAKKGHTIRGKHTQDYQTEIKQERKRDSEFIKRSGPVELRINGKGDLHILDQVLVSNKETGLEKLTLKRCPPLELKHLLMLTNLKTLIVKYSDDTVRPIGGQVEVEWQLPVWFPKLQELEISNCPEFSPLIPISWIESLHRVRIRQVKLLKEFTYSKSSDGAELEIIGEGDLHSFDQVLVFDKETSLEKLALERCPPLELKHLLKLTSLKILIVESSDALVGPLGGGQGDVEWQLPVWFPKLQELTIWNCPEFSSLIPMSWIESLDRVTMKHVKLLEEFKYFKSWHAVLEIKGKCDLHNLDQVLVFDKETSLTELTLEKCPPLELKHLLMLTSLKKLFVKYSDSLVGPLGGGQGDVEWQLLVEHIEVDDLNGNIGKELTELLPHLPRLYELKIMECKNIKQIVMRLNVQQTRSEASEIVEGEITAATEEEDDGVLLFPAHLCDSLRELEFHGCTELVLVDPRTLVPGGGGLQACRSLQRLTIRWSPKFLSTFSFSCHIFPSSLQFLDLVGVDGMGTLEPLSNLSSLTRLVLSDCGEDLKCQGLESLLTTGGQLNELRVFGCPRFFAGWDPNPKRALEDLEGGEEQQTQLFSSTLWGLGTDDAAGLLSAPICSFLSSSLTKLELYGHGSEGMERFSKEQEDALQLLCSLQQLWFTHFDNLQYLPAGLGNLTSLKKLSIYDCPAVSSLPNDGLPESLQELYVRYSGSQELKQQCRGLEGTIPRVIID